MAVLKLLVVDDDQDGGIALAPQRPPTGPQPTPGAPTVYASVSGKCINDLAKAGTDARSSITNNPTGRCDLAHGGVIKIRLDVDVPKIRKDAIFVPGTEADPRYPPLCIKKLKTDAMCLAGSVKSISLSENNKVASVAVNKLPDLNGSDMYYSVNLQVPDASGNYSAVTLDPKIINRPKLEGDVALAFLGILVTGAVTLVARRLLLRTNLTADRGFALSVLAGLIVGAVAVLIARNALLG